MEVFYNNLSGHKIRSMLEEAFDFGYNSPKELRDSVISEIAESIDIAGSKGNSKICDSASEIKDIQERMNKISFNIDSLGSNSKREKEKAIRESFSTVLVHPLIHWFSFDFDKYSWKNLEKYLQEQLETSHLMKTVKKSMVVSVSIMFIDGSLYNIALVLS